MYKKTCECEKRPMKETYKRDLYLSTRRVQEMCSFVVPSTLDSSKETCIYEKRPLSMKRDLYLWKQTSIYEKRPLSKKRDLYLWKETSIYEKRPVKGTYILYMCQTISLQCYRGGTWSIVTKGILVIIKRRLQKFSGKLVFFSKILWKISFLFKNSVKT